MAAAATLLRGPLRQVGSSPRRALGRPVPSLNLLLSPRQVSGLLKRRFHRSAPAAVQVNGSEAGPGREGVLGPESRPEAGGGIAGPGSGRVRPKIRLPLSPHGATHTDTQAGGI